MLHCRPLVGRAGGDAALDARLGLGARARTSRAASASSGGRRRVCGRRPCPASGPMPWPSAPRSLSGPSGPWASAAGGGAQHGGEADGKQQATGGGGHAQKVEKIDRLAPVVGRAPKTRIDLNTEPQPRLRSAPRAEVRTMIRRAALPLLVVLLASAFATSAAAAAVRRSTPTAASSRSTPPAWPPAPDVAARPRRQDGRDQEGRLARRRAVPQRQAGRRLPRAPAAGGATSGPLTVLTDAVGAAEHGRLQPDDPVRRLRLPDDARRHQARLLGAPADRTSPNAAGHRPPARPGRPAPYPTLIEYSGYGYANPAGPQSGIAVARQPDGLRGRRRQHARHRLLRRRVRLLRAAAEPRRLRRHRDRSRASRGSSTTRSA